MGRLLGMFGGLFALLLVPLALAPHTSWLLLPGHLLFSLVTIGGTLQQGFEGRPRGAQAWGALYVAVSIGIAIALETGAGARESWYWMAPWSILLLWAWIPAICIVFGSWIGEVRRNRLSQYAVRKRKQARATNRGKETAAHSSERSVNE